MTEYQRKPVALVTGGSGGIGQAVCLAFAEAGYRVAVHYHRNKSGAEALAETIRERGCDAMCVQSDLAGIADAESVVRQVNARLGRVDVLVNNAGAAMQKLFLDTDEADWRRMMAVDLDAVFYMTKAVLPGMLHEHAGVILNISSMWGQVGGSMETAYSAAKAGVIGLTRALAKELGMSGVRVNCVAPGVIDTPMNGMLDDEALEELRQETPLCRIGTPEDVALSCVFLAGKGGAFYTGQVLAPNGGMVIG